MSTNVSKRICALLLALMLVLSTALCVGAAGDDAAGLGLEAKFGSDDVTVTVRLDRASGVTNGGVRVVWDPEAAVLTDVQAVLDCGASSINRSQEGTVSLAWVGSDLKESAGLMKLTFRVSGEAIFQAEATELYAGDAAVLAGRAALTVNTTPFVDIEGHWAEAEIVAAYHAGLVDGIGGGYFAPDAEINRAAFVTMLYRMAGEPGQADLATGFADVPADSFYGAAVKWAVENGITNGVSSTLFAPEMPVSRQQMMTMLWRYAKNVEGRDVSASADLGTFTDGDAVAPWAVDAMSWALAVELLNGYPDGSVRPETTAVRAQAAAIFCRYMGL